MAGSRVLQGVLTLLLVSVLVFAATQVLPGNAATAILGSNATPERQAQLEEALHLDRSAPAQYWTWLSGVVTGDLGKSLAGGGEGGQPQQHVSEIVLPPISNSVVLIGLAALIGGALGVALGVYAAARRDSAADHALSLGALVITSLPEFVVGIALVIVFSTGIFPVFPAVSALPPGTSPFASADQLVLPVATLVLVIVPYIMRMARAAMIEALESDYVEMARLKGVAPTRVLLLHALPNAAPAVVQVIGLNLLYLAGGIVVVEALFNYPGIGQTLVNAVSNRDVPTIQALVLMLGAFYVLVNIVSDVLTLLATPRRRLPRTG